MFRPLALLLALSLAEGAFAADPPTQAAEKPENTSPIKIRPKKTRGEGATGEGALLQPDVNLIDVPTAAVLDFGGYSAQTRFFSNGGLLNLVSFGVYQNLDLGASLAMDGLIGNNRTVRLRAPNVQAKYRFFDGDRWIPAFAVGFDGQGYLYNQPNRRYNQRQRGFFVVASQELALPGLQVHPSINISDFDSNSFFGALPLSYTIQDKVSLLLEWDNINTVINSRLNSGLRIYVTAHFHVDFAVRGIGQGGRFSNDDSRGPERIVQLRYSSSF
jgi:hypothetical protein